MIELSPGQALAIDQLIEISARSDGALEIMGEPFAQKGEEAVWLRISLETRSYRQVGGLPLRDREPLALRIYPDFPFSKPALYFGHKRYKGYPHVQWGSYVCLHQSEAEYDPADGMYGYMERVRVWMQAAGKGELDPEDAPLHPPVAYVTSNATFVARADTPVVEPDGPFWIGRATLKRVREGRFDLIEWSHISEWGDDLPENPVAGAILLSMPLATEYPTKIYDLTKLVEEAGVPFESLYSMLRLVSLMTEQGAPGFIVLGAPMRRKAAGEPLRQHLTVWEIAVEPMRALRAIILKGGDDAAARAELVKWLVEADVLWCETMEDREEVVHRRDDDTSLAATKGKRILLFGCGALGSAVAEMVVRAGASKLHLIDNGRVRPGVLVRQRYSDADIGLNKAQALKARLDSQGLPCDVIADTFNLATRTLAHFDLNEYDLLIDATASTRVTHRIERDLEETGLSIPMMALTVSASANHGCVVVRMPEFQGGPHSLLRQAKLEAMARNPQHPLVKAFWPEPGSTKVFQPEPGCSEPTFIGSAADIDYHASALLNIGVMRLRSLDSSQAGMDLLTAPWLQRSSQEASLLSYSFTGNATSIEQRHGYTVRVSDDANKGMVATMRRIARVRTRFFETGGLIFGDIDDSHRDIWIDSVSGPPPDSESSPEKFLCGTSGTSEMARLKAERSGGSSRFIGIWHTHPVSVGQPSQDDLTAMLALLHGQEHPPRQVVMLIVGTSATTPVYNYYLYRRGEFRIIFFAGKPAESE